MSDDKQSIADVLKEIEQSYAQIRTKMLTGEINIFRALIIEIRLNRQIRNINKMLNDIKTVHNDVQQTQYSNWTPPPTME